MEDRAPAGPWPWVFLSLLGLALGATVAWATPEARLDVAAAPVHDDAPVTAVFSPARAEPETELPLAPSPDPFAAALARGRIVTGHTPHRLILFTFDDGPDERNTPRLLDLLDDRGVKALFFLTASRLVGHGTRHARRRAIVEDIAARGHVIGNHTVDHLQLPLLTDVEVGEQIDGAEQLFVELLGERTWLFRPPGGARSARVDRLIAERGYTQVLWNLGTGDFQVRAPEDVAQTWRRVFRRAEREHEDQGGIVLLHDIHEWSVDGFSLIYDELERRNCELLARGEELYDVVDDPALFFAARDDADASAEAPPAAPTEAIIAERQERLRRATEQRCSGDDVSARPRFARREP